MKESFTHNLYLALIHYPVVNKNGDTIASAVTNLDLHDISRLTRTYGVRRFYVVTPLKDQIKLVERIISHWTDGAGATYNPKRRQALERTCIKETLADVLDHIRQRENMAPVILATCAKKKKDNIRFSLFRDMLKDGKPHLMLFGTAWGLSEKVIAEADYVLEPVLGSTAYNHLSVRSAAAIILDRLVGRDR